MRARVTFQHPQRRELESALQKLPLLPGEDFTIIVGDDGATIGPVLSIVSTKDFHNLPSNWRPTQSSKPIEFVYQTPLATPTPTPSDPLDISDIVRTVEELLEANR